MSRYVKTNLFLILMCLTISIAASALHAGAAWSTTPKQKLIIGDDINYPPYSYIDENGNPAGFNVELAKRAAETMGYEVEIRLDEWSRTRAALESGDIDVISGMFYSKERESSYRFTVRHSIANGAIFTRKDLVINDLESLKGKTVVVQAGDIVGEFISSIDPNITLVPVATVEEALKLISEGTYDQACLLKLPGLYTIKQKDMTGIIVQSPVLTPVEYCMAVRKDNEALQLTLNSGLQALKASGEYKRIYDRWLGVNENPTITDVIKANAWVLLIPLTIIAGLSVWNLLLKASVHRRTHELLETNTLLSFKNDELNSIQERQQALIKALPDLLFVLDNNGIFLDCQVGSPDELLYPPEDFIGKKLGDIMPENVAHQGMLYIGRALSTGRLQTFEYDIPTPVGISYFEMRITKSRHNEVVAIARNITPQKHYRNEIEFLSYHDQLTGLYNRRYFEVEIKRLDVKRNLPMSIIMADVNGLKLINDSFGHESGDALLKSFSDVLALSCRADDIVCRIGGDEFVILLPSTDLDEAEKLVLRIRESCSERNICGIDLSASFGIDVKTSEIEDVNEVFNKAEDMMYKDKLFEGPSMRGRTIRTLTASFFEVHHSEELHSDNVTRLVVHLAQHLGLSPKATEDAKNAALLHDIGKIAIQGYLLDKVGPLTSDEMDEVRRHPEIGYRILSSVNDTAEIALYILSHHERWDGKGYPQGLMEEAIPLYARMIAIADAYDALTSARTYKHAVSESDALQELLGHAGTQFDPHLVQQFVAMVSSESFQ